MTLTAKTGEIVLNREIFFTNTDVNTSNIYLTLIIEDITNIKIYLAIETDKDNNRGELVEGILVNEEKHIYEFDIPSTLLTAGNHNAQYIIVLDERQQIRHSDIFNIKVNRSITT